MLEKLTDSKLNFRISREILEIAGSILLGKILERSTLGYSLW